MIGKSGNYNFVMFLWSRPVPVFPLPHCVVLPGVVQALHIFEARYREMVADEIARSAPDRLIAVALLKPGYEPHYYTHHAPSHPTVCVCQIIKHQALPDGRSNILVLGKCRASIKQQLYRASYRLALLEPQPTINDLSVSEEEAMRRKLADRLQQLPEKLLQLCCEMLAPESDLERVVDMIAFHLLGPEAAPAKQMILAEPRLDFRIQMLVTLIERLYLRNSSGNASSNWPACRDQN